MKCVNCGYEYFSKETLDKGICPACGRSLTVADESYVQKASTPVNSQKARPLDLDSEIQVEAAISSAINIRRIALAVVLAVVLAIGSLLVSLMVPITFTINEHGDVDITGERILLAGWLIAALGIMIYGLYVIVYKKKLSSL